MVPNMTKTIKILFVLLFFHGCSCAFAEHWESSSYIDINGKDVSYLNISDILFHNTENWIPISTFPVVEQNNSDYLYEKLKEAYLKSEIKKNESLSNCEYFNKILHNEAREGLRIFDINNDGNKDIIYFGSDGCSEQQLTLIWYGTKDGYEIKQNKNFNLIILKVLPGKIPNFTSVEIGCCASPIDIFYKGDINNIYGKQEITITKDLTFPEKFLDENNKFINNQESLFRTSPVVINKLNAEEINYITDGMIGNITSKFRNNLSGFILGKYIDSHGKPWVFVYTEESSKKHRYFSAYDEIYINAGWIEEEHIKIMNKNP